MHLTQTQIKILDYISACDYPPTISEIQESLGVSRNHVTGLINGSVLIQTSYDHQDAVVQYCLTRSGRSWYESHKSNFETHPS